MPGEDVGFATTGTASRGHHIAGGGKMVTLGALRATYAGIMGRAAVTRVAAGDDRITKLSEVNTIETIAKASAQVLRRSRRV